MERSAAIVGVDIGTTGAKAVTYAPGRRVLAHERKEYPLRDRAEQDPDELFEAVLDSLSGAAAFSPVNDSGFWLVSRYLGISEKHTLQSWTVMVTIIGLVGFSLALAIRLLP